jgi:hypothetical protein
MVGFSLVIFRKGFALLREKTYFCITFFETEKTIMENYMAKAADAFLTGRPYGIRLDFKHKGFALFNYNMNELGNHLPGRLETLPLEDFDVEDIPLCGEHIVRKENITDIFFYDEKSNPYSDNRVDMKKLKAYNKYIYPLSLILNRNL